MNWRNFFFFSGACMAQVAAVSAVIISLFVAPLLFTGFPVEIAADVMGRLFAPYGWILVVATSFVTIGLILLWRVQDRLPKTFYRICLSLSVTAWGAALVQALYLFPVSHSLRNIVKAARAAGNIDPVAEQAAEMMRLHGLSVAVNNFSIFCALVLAGAYLHFVSKWESIRRW